MSDKGPSHWSVYPGKRVLVRLHSGEIITGKFEEKRSKWVVVDGRKIWRCDIAAFSLLKHAHFKKRRLGLLLIALLLTGCDNLTVAKELLQREEWRVEWTWRV